MKKARIGSIVSISAVVMLIAGILLPVALAAGPVDPAGGGTGMQGGMGGPGAGDGSGYTGGTQQNQTQMQDGMRQMEQMAIASGLFGGVDYSGGAVTGRFVDFAVDNLTGGMSNYSVSASSGTVTVFSAINLTGFAPTSIETIGSVFLMLNATVTAAVHDNPTALLHLASNGSALQAQFVVGGAMSAIVLPTPGGSAKVSVVQIAGNGVDAFLRIVGGSAAVVHDASISSTIVTITGHDALFRMTPIGVGHHYQDSALQQAVQAGNVAGEISFVASGGISMYDAMQYQPGFAMEVTAAEANNFALSLSSSDHAGRVVVVNMDKGALDINQSVILSLDGTAISSTADPLQVLYANGSAASDALFCVIDSGPSATLLVYVPSFSTHNLDIVSVSPLAAILGVSGVLAVSAAAMFVVGAGYVLLHRKK